MLLTIALPVFNDASALSATIDSLLKQEVEWGKTVEIVVSDNFSSDHAAELAEKQLADTSGCRVFMQSENLGFLGNLRFLNQEANGEYIWFIGAGDTLVDGTLGVILGILGTNEYDWGTVRALFDYQDNSGYSTPEQVLVDCDSQEISGVAVFNHAISMNIVRRQVFNEFTSCFAHGTSLKKVAPKANHDEANGALALWEDERCYWPHLEAIALFCSKHVSDRLSWFEYHEVSVLLSDNKNGNWDKGLSAMKIFAQWIQVVAIARESLPHSVWLEDLNKELQNIHFLRFTFMVKKDGNLSARAIANEVYAADVPGLTKAIAWLISWTPSLVLRLLAQSRTALRQLRGRIVLVKPLRK
jgi:glycosyltransferase involved in cell wall biosynthesis